MTVTTKTTMTITTMTMTKITLTTNQGHAFNNKALITTKMNDNNNPQ